MAKLIHSLRSLYNSIVQFVDTLFGRVEEAEAEKALPTQRNRYYT